MQVGISFHLSEEDRDRIDLLSKRDGIARTRWIKRQILKGLKEEEDFLSLHGVPVEDEEAAALVG